MTIAYKHVWDYVFTASVIGISTYIYYIVLNYVLHLMFNSSLLSSDQVSQNIIIALIGGLASGLLVSAYSKHLDESKNFCQDMKDMKIDIDSPVKNELSSYQNPSIDDIDNFCKTVIAWKISASKKDELFVLFKDNPYYLIGYLTYITQKDVEETKILQNKILRLTKIMGIFAAGTFVFAMYSINSQFIGYGLVVAVMIIVAVLYMK